MVVFLFLIYINEEREILTEEYRITWKKQSKTVIILVIFKYTVVCQTLIYSLKNQGN